jgi:chloride channel protein, CIC family
MINLPHRENYIPVLESCIIGCISGLSAVLLSIGISSLGTLRIHLSTIWHPYLIFVLGGFGLAGGLIAGYLVQTIAPETSGSGIPQVKAQLDRIVMPLNFRTAIAKLIGSIAAIGSGLFLGREGPTVQLGAALAVPLGHLFSNTAVYNRQLIAAGAGAGLAAAFNAPLAGIVFVLEELLKEIKPSTVVITTVACASSSLIVNMFSNYHTRAAAESLREVVSFAPIDLLFYILLGIIAGLYSAAFNKGIIYALNFNRKMVRIPVTLRVGLAGLLSGLVIASLPEYFHNYAGMRGLIIAGETNLNTVLLALIDFTLLTLLAYGSGAPGGLFAPALAIGSTLGYLVGFCEHSLLGSGSTVAFALVGMGAFFAAVARVPLTAIVITFELTTNFTLVVPLMVTCIVSSVVAELVSKEGLYDRLMRWNGIHLRGPGTSATWRILKAFDVMHTEYEHFDSKTLIKNILPILSSSAQRGFPVADNGKLVGVVTQTDLSNLTKEDPLNEMTISEIMTPHPVAVSPFDSLEDILFLFSRHKFTWLPVVQQNNLKGIILQSDLLSALFSQEK